jgi:hypothetical protein
VREEKWGAAPLRAYRFFVLQQGGSGTRPYLDQHHPPFAVRNSPFAVFSIRHSLFAARDWPRARCRCHNTTRAGLGPAPTRIPPFAIRYSPFAALGGCPQTHVWRNSVTVGARHASPLPLPTSRSPIAARDGARARCRRHNTTRAGLGPAPTWTSTIHHSRFAIRHSR